MYVCFSDSVYVVFARFRNLAPPSIGVAPVNVHRIYGFLENSSRTSRTGMNNMSGTSVPIFILEDFRALRAFAGDLLPVFKGTLG